jgi:hypothetical protein
MPLEGPHHRGAVDLQVIDDKPAEIVERFFLEVIRPRLNGRVQSMAVWTAYQVWCEQRGYSAVSHAMFGRLARWRKDRVGGTVWYLDAELAEGYVGLAPVSAPQSTPRARHYRQRHADGALGPVLNYTDGDGGSSRLGASRRLVGVQRNCCAPLERFRV